MTTDDEKGAQMAQMIQDHSENPEEEEESMSLDLNSMCKFSSQSDAEAIETSFPDEVLEHVLVFLTARKDRNAVSLVCKSWYRVEAWTRHQVFIGNCYALSPVNMIRRFGKIKSVTLKGKPRFADFSLVPPNWGAHLYPWVSAMAPAYPWLEKLSLKRMTVTDEDLALLANSFPNFKDLVLLYCDGFTTRGLGMIASKCRQLRRLDLNEDDIQDGGVDWLSCFPETTTTLECLSFECLDCSINIDALERLVARCRSLKELRLNRSISIVQLHRLMLRAPQLTHLGTGCFSYDFIPEQATVLQVAFNNCRSLQCLSGFREVVPEYLPTIYSVCNNLMELNFSYAVIGSRELEQIVCNCPKLQRLWVCYLPCPLLWSIQTKVIT